MLRLIRICRHISSRNRTLHITHVALGLALLCAGHLSAQTVATYSFEDGTAGGWASFNGATRSFGHERSRILGFKQPSHDHKFKWSGRTLHLDEQRVAARRSIHHHRLCAAYPRRKRHFGELHHQAQRSELFRRHMLRHHWRIHHACDGFWLGADRRKLHCEHD